MGKGSKQRPTNKTSFDENFDRIFGGKNRVQSTAGNQESESGRRHGTDANPSEGHFTPCQNVPNKE